MSYCPKCGWMNSEGAAFCQKCGVRLLVEDAPAVFRPMESQFDRSFKGAGPLLKAVLGFIFVLLVIEVLNALSGGSQFADRFGSFLNDNLLLIFLMMLLAAYSGFSSRRYHREYSFISPLIAAILITFVLWVLANMLDLMGRSQDVDQLEIMSDLLFSILYIIFLLVVLVGYIGAIMRADRPQPPRSVPPSQTGPPFNGPQPGQPYAPSTRLTRSSRDKVIFGVCGGMAEYFRTDPFLIRLLWVVGFLVSFGVFVLAYLIMAVVLPKYP